MARKGKPKFRFREIYEKLNKPNRVATLVYVVALVICPLVFVMAAFGYGRGTLSGIAYAVSGIMFLYSVYMTVIYLKRFKRKLTNVADRYGLKRNFYRTYEFRTIFFGLCSLIFNVGYTVFLCVMAIVSHSIWYGALATYYSLLSATRGGLLYQNYRDQRKYKGEPTRLQLEKTGTYRYCGIMLIVLTLSLSVGVVQQIVAGEGVRVPQGATYAYAAFAFCRILVAVYNFIKANKRDDMTVRAVRNINLATALVSVLTLQTALFNAFPPDFDTSLFNSVTGFLVCLFIVALGIYMILFSGSVRKQLRIRLLKETTEKELAVSSGYNREEYAEEYADDRTETEPAEEEEDLPPF